ncbi:nucleoside phosphorylase domain-containing protein [Trichoderma compactum]
MPRIPERDDQYYYVGRMGKHNVVALCLPFCLLIGIGGGVPSSRNDIQLGDVVVSHPTGDHSGVIQYDFEKVLLRGKLKRIGSLKRPPDFLLAAISYLRSDPDFSPDCLLKDITLIGKRNPSYRYPGLSDDRLFTAECEHDSNEIHRNKRQILDGVSVTHQAPAIHYGIIASGNRVIENAQVRDAISKKYDAICFEMEAAGVMDNIPCLVIRGICDYADSHKNDVWQKYAAAAAAAYAKLLLSVVRTRTKR